MSETQSEGFENIIKELDQVKKDVLACKPEKKKINQLKKELRYRLSSEEDSKLILAFEELCRNTQRTPRAILFNLIDEWTREEGSKLYGADEIARRLEGE